MPRHAFKLGLLASCLFLAPGLARLPAAEVIPPAPAAYFNDFAGVVSPATARSLDSQLEQFERDTSDQIVVAIYPSMQSDSSVEDYTVRVAQAWRAGRKGLDNGAVLFVFVSSHDLRIQTGYGLEGALPDALCKRIVEDEIFPRFRAGDFDGGMRAGVRAILAAAKGEYRGTGRTVADARAGGGAPFGLVRILFILVLLVVFSVARSRQHVVYGAGGRSRTWGGGGPWIIPGGGGGGWSGGGGFSGGGGGFGGGGAGGKW